MRDLRHSVRRSLIYPAALLAALVLLPVNAEHAFAQQGTWEGTGDLPADPAGSSEADSALPDSAATPVPERVEEWLGSLTEPSVSVDTAVWRDGVLTLYATGQVSALRQSAERQLEDVQVRVTRSAHPKAAVQAAIRAIVNDPGVRKHGAFVAETIPSEDGSRIDVGIAGAGAAAAVRGLGGSILGIEVEAAVVEAPIAATRNRTVAPVLSGQYMQNASSSCTTGFWIGKSTGERALISADHCGGTVGETWYYGGGTTAGKEIGTAQGQAPGGTDLELFMTSSTANVSGYVLVGTYADSSSAAPIRGRYSQTVIGGSVCYSGSRSGLVCQNIITSYAGSVCYDTFQCYYNVTRTTQTNGIPAVGNGDSGGPVITVLTGGHVYATGIISGMSNASDNCTGDPGTATRKCSDKVIYAPLEAYFNNTSGWGLVYIPQ